MAFNINNRRAIDSFFSAIEPIAKAYRYKVFSYVAVQSSDSFILCDGRIILHTTDPKRKQRDSFDSENVKAGRIDLDKLGINLREFLESFSRGVVELPDCSLVFPVSEPGGFETYFDPYHQEGLQEQYRLNLLTISGAFRHPLIKQPNIDWELIASSEPYLSLQELQGDFGVGLPISDRIRLDVVASNTARVSALHSSVLGQKAFPAVLVAPGIPVDEITLGFRILNQNAVVDRFSLSGTKLSWEEYEGFQLGQCEIVVPAGAVVHTIVSCCGLAQNHYFLADPANSQNSRRSAYIAFDSEFEVMREFLNRTDEKGQRARDFEIGVAWLFWMLGFNIAHLGITNKVQDALDIVAVTPKGHFAMVECTTGLLKSENKLQSLIARTESVKSNLIDSGNSHLEVMPVMITSKSRAQVRADLEHAKSLSVLVLTKEDIERLLDRTLLQLDPDLLYEEAKKNITSSQGELPLANGD